MFSERKFLNLPRKTQAKRLADLLRILVLRLGKDTLQIRSEYERYADWLSLPPEARIDGKNQAELIELYRNFRTDERYLCRCISTTA